MEDHGAQLSSRSADISVASVRHSAIEQQADRIHGGSLRSAHGGGVPIGDREVPTPVDCDWVHQNARVLRALHDEHISPKDFSDLPGVSIDVTLFLVYVVGQAHPHVGC